jgi:hypothetical protein
MHSDIESVYIFFSLFFEYHRWYYYDASLATLRSSGTMLSATSYQLSGFSLQLAAVGVFTITSACIF